MKKLLLLTLLLPSMIFADNCTAILKQSSHQYVNQYTAQHDSSTLSTVTALQNYTRCYQQKIMNIKQNLSATGKGPLMGVMGNYHDLQSALNAFTGYAQKLTATGGTFDQIQDAYTKLYALKFSMAFYQAYQQPSHQASNQQQLYTLQNYVHTLIKQFSKNDQNQLEQLLDNLETSAVQGLNLSPTLVYQYAALLLETPADKPVAKPLV